MTCIEYGHVAHLGRPCLALPRKSACEQRCQAWLSKWEGRAAKPQRCARTRTAYAFGTQQIEASMHACMSYKALWEMHVHVRMERVEEAGGGRLQGGRGQRHAARCRAHAHTASMPMLMPTRPACT